MKKIVKKICFGKESLAWYNNYIYFVKKKSNKNILSFCVS